MLISCKSYWYHKHRIDFMQIILDSIRFPAASIRILRFNTHLADCIKFLSFQYVVGGFYNLHFAYFTSEFGSCLVISCIRLWYFKISSRPIQVVLFHQVENNRLLEGKCISKSNSFWSFFSIIILQLKDKSQ